MLSVLSYGRIVARAVLGGLSQTDGRDYKLVTASCGFGKDFRKGILKKGMCYGDDACFIARHRSADVLGKKKKTLLLLLLLLSFLHFFLYYLTSYHSQASSKLVFRYALFKMTHSINSAQNYRQVTTYLVFRMTFRG